jgi:hypothetical protein
MWSGDRHRDCDVELRLAGARVEQAAPKVDTMVVRAQTKNVAAAGS